MTASFVRVRAEREQPFGSWVRKASEEMDWEAIGGCELVVMLLPANRTEQGWWQDLVEPYRDRAGSRLTTEFLRGRRRFVMPGNDRILPNERPPFGSVLAIWSDQSARSEGVLVPDTETR